jgi:hypothetical protein
MFHFTVGPVRPLVLESFRFVFSLQLSLAPPALILSSSVTLLVCHHVTPIALSGACGATSAIFTPRGPMLCYVALYRVPVSQRLLSAHVALIR